MNKPTRNFNPISAELLTGINLIEASAGTGKTYAIALLVLRFVVEQALDIKQILVVTFTKAATKELKERIRNRLAETRQAVLSNHYKIDDEIKQWLENLEIEQDIVIHRLNNALLDIDQAGIFTIHGFCQRILTEHALESGQLFDSELVGDISAIKQACSDDFWRKQIYQRSAWEASILMAQYQTPDQLLASVDYISADLTIVPGYKDLNQALDQLKLITDNNKDDIILSLHGLQEKLHEGKFKVSFSHYFNDNSDNLVTWIDGNCNTTPEFSLFSNQGLVDALNGQKFRKSKANPLSGDEQKRAYIEALEFDSKPFEQLASAIENISLVFRRSLLQTLSQDLNNKLEQLNVLSFDELIVRLAAALQGQKGQNLCQEIQQRYLIAMIDEFQDTDQDQWFIFSTLFNTNKQSLYLIGDPKQAIYKFRGADIQSYFGAKKQAKYYYSLGYNWRSHPQLVEGINTLFSTNNAFLSEELQFNAVNAALTSEDGALLQKDQALAPLVLWQLDKSENEFWTSGKATSEIICAIVNEIHDLLYTDYTLSNNTIQPKDIAILVRSNPQAKDFQLALNESGITAVINSKESVFCSAEAMDLYTLLQAVAQPANIPLLKQALTLYGFNLSGQQLFQTLNDEVEMEGFITRFLSYQQDWQSKGLMAMMQRLLVKESFLLHLSKDKLAERRITNLHHCIELVQQAAIDEHLGINKTLDWLHRNINLSTSANISTDEQQLRLESDDNAIKIITMHSSKGLEYPIVFCPFLWQRGNRLSQEQSVIKCHENGFMIADIGSNDFEKHRQSALKEELEEDLRVFYVAVTRAKYRCYINWADVRTKGRANESAMAYLMDFSAADFEQQQYKLQNFANKHPAVFEYRLLDAEQQVNKTRRATLSVSEMSFKKRQRSLYSNWQMSSYTALSSLTVYDAPELPEDKAREDALSNTVETNKSELPRGSHTGNVIHELLEHIPFQILAGNNDISLQRDRSCLRYGLKTESPELIDHLLSHTVNTPLSTEEGSFSLKQLKQHQCLKEMPFYLSMKATDTNQINHILLDSPTYQPLSAKNLSGYLTGFIDLVCEFNGKYYVMDYKSNYLEAYQQENLIQAMAEHNYGLQYWIYTLVLHQYLQHRLPGYDYQQHFGGVKYLFVRGMDKNQENSGVYEVKPELMKLEQLARLFINR